VGAVLSTLESNVLNNDFSLNITQEMGITEVFETFKMWYEYSDLRIKNEMHICISFINKLYTFNIDGILISNNFIIQD
jgi:hypothetical protein